MFGATLVAAFAQLERSMNSMRTREAIVSRRNEVAKKLKKELGREPSEDEIKKALSNCKKIHYSHIANVYAMKEWKVDIPFTISDVIIDYLNKQDIPQTTEEIKEGVELVRFEYCSEMRKKIKDEKRDLFCYFENERIGLKTQIS